MAGGKRKRQQQQQQQQDAPTKVARATVSAADDEQAIDVELKRVNDLLQSEETSQKQTWQIGKRVKQLLETFPHMAPSKAIDAYFLWGTALARLASLNDDPTLAEAAADKFQELYALADGDADEAIGPVGYSLWASSLLIVAIELQQPTTLDAALDKFAQAVDVDGGTTFETRFQFAKALKEGGDLIQHLTAATATATTDDHKETATPRTAAHYYERALDVCATLERVCEQATVAHATAANDRTSDESDDEADIVQIEDVADVKLLEAVLHGALANSSNAPFKHFATTRALFMQALAISPDNPDVLLALANYVTTTLRLDDGNNDTNPPIDWSSVLHDVVALFTQALHVAEFDLLECDAICKRKDLHQQDEQNEIRIDERVPHLLHALGTALAAFVATHQQFGNKRWSSRVGNVDAIHVLRTAHHFHDKLGCYPLAKLYATRGIEHDDNCRMWLETAESYGVLDDEMVLEDFVTMHDRKWFTKFLTPVEAIDAMDGESEEEEENEEEEDE